MPLPRRSIVQQVASTRGPTMIVCSAASARAWQRRLSEVGVASAAWTRKKTWRDDRGIHIRTRGPEDIARCPYDVAIVPPRLAADERESLSERRWGTLVLEWVTIYFHIALMAEIDRSSRVVADEGIRLTIALDPDFVQHVVSRSIVHDNGGANLAAFEELAREAMANIEAVWPVPDGVYSMGPAGSLRVARAAGGPPAFHFGGDQIPTDQRQPARKVWGDLDAAVKQLKRGDGPGVIVLDTCHDGLLRNQFAEVAEFLHAQDWDRLAGVLVLDRRVNGTPDCMAIFARGPCWAEALPMLHGFRSCDHGHLHAHSGVFLAPRCSSPSFL